MNRVRTSTASSSDFPVGSPQDLQSDHLRIVSYVLHKHFRALRGKHEFDDLFQIGSVALFRALGRDVRRPLVPYLCDRIRGAMLNYLAQQREDSSPQHRRGRARKLKQPQFLDAYPDRLSHELSPLTYDSFVKRLREKVAEDQSLVPFQKDCILRGLDGAPQKNSWREPALLLATDAIAEICP